MPKRKSVYIAACCCFIAALMLSGVPLTERKQAEALEAQNVPPLFENDILLYVGSSAAYVRGKGALIDSGNREVVPYIRNNRVFVPIRFISEHIGAEVDWNPDSYSVGIRLDGDVVKMAVGDTTAYGNNRTVTLDAAPEIAESRTMVPLRAVAELLGKSVHWDDRGLIAVSGANRFAGNIDETAASAAVRLFHTLLPVSAIAASSDDGNAPANAIDGDLATRWSANGDGEWLEIDLGSTQSVGYGAIAFYKGTERTARFRLQWSLDGNSWRPLYSGTSSGTDNELQKFDFPDVQARYVRYEGDGNSNDSWNSVTEFQLYAPNEHGMTIMRIPFVSGSGGSGGSGGSSSGGGGGGGSAGGGNGNTGGGGGSGSGGGSVDRSDYDKAGLYGPGGAPHPVHSPNPVTGRTLNVLDYGADPANNGDDDRPAIQAAIEAARFGDEVYLPAGTYNLRSTVRGDTAHLRLKNGVNLRGESETGTVLLSDFDRGDDNSKVLLAEAAHDIAISHLTLSSTHNGRLSTNYRRNNPERGGPKHGIYIADSRGNPSYNITIDRVTVEKFETIGIRISDSRDIVVRRSTFRRATDVGGGGAGYGVAIQGRAKRDMTGERNDTLYNLVEDSVFEGPYLRHAVVIQYNAHNNAVRNSRFDRIALNAIDLHGEDEYANEIYGNRISGSRNEAAIGVGNGGGEPPYNHDAAGPRNHIHDNVITDSVEGVSVILGSPDTVIERNTITDAAGGNARGIIVRNGPGTVIRENAIIGNSARGFWAIHLERDPGDRNAGNAGRGNPADVLIERNEIAGSTNGIKIDAGERIVLRGNVLRDIGGAALNIADGAQVRRE